MTDFTGLLYARPSAIEGIARLLDFTGALDEYNNSPDGETADYRAERSDWRAVGEDLRRALDTFAARLAQEPARSADE